MTTTKITVPAFATVLEQFVTLALEAPEQTARHAYLDSNDAPHCLIAHVYAAQGGDLRVFKGLRQSSGTPMNNVPLIRIWEELYADGDRMFLSRAKDLNVTKQFLTRNLMVDVQHAQDHYQGGWKSQLIKGLQKNRRIVDHEIATWGRAAHLVDGEHLRFTASVEDEYRGALVLLDYAIARLKAA
jgi:hypothetical protein